jgi:DNA-binding MarR family transcriptional regulator
MQETFTQAIAKYGVTAPQWAVLSALYDGKASTPAELSQYIGIDRSAVTRLCDRLVAKGLLIRKPDSSDRRSIKIELTQKGREVTPKLAKISKEGNEKFLVGLSESEIRQFKSIISKLLEAAEVKTPKLWKKF